MSDIPPPPYNNPGFSNYPRSGFIPGEPSRPPGIYFDYISEAWRLVSSNLSTWVLSTLIFFGITYGVNIPLSLVGNYVAYGSVLGATRTPTIPGILTSFAIEILGIFITYPIQAGMLNMALRQVRGYQVQPGDVFSGFSMTGQVVFGYFLMGLLTSIGFLCCIIPSFYVFGVVAFVPLLIVDRRMSAIEAVQESYRALKPFAWAMFGFLFVLGLISSAGICAFCIGMLFTFPVYVMAQALTYSNFYPAPNEPASWNPIGIEPPR
ncbi:MAG: hypothetical protein P4L46_14880 [Fimbriimonas sp.]|nr:hypothetical protein [Fimbriimonas sp.]